MDFHGTHERPGTAAVMQDMGLAEGIRLMLQNVKQFSTDLPSTVSKNMQISTVS